VADDAKRGTAAPAGVDDAALGDGLRAGDRAAFEAILDRYEDNLAAFVLRIVGMRVLAEELMPEVWAAVWLRRAQYDPARGALWTFLTKKVARGIALTHLRARKRGLERDGTAAGLRTSAPQLDAGGAGDSPRSAQVVVADDPDPEVSSDEERRRAWLRAEVAALPEAQRETMEAALFEGLTAPELAARTGEPLATVSKRLQRGVASLQSAWRKFTSPGASGETP